MEVDRLIRLQAGRIFRSEGNLKRALLNIRENPADFIDRLTTYNEVCSDLNSLLKKPWFTLPEKSWRKNAVALAESYKVKRVESASSIARRTPKKGRETMRDILDRIQTREWEFPRTVNDPNTLISGMFIEGGGLHLRRKLQQEGVDRTFVLGFEEILLTNFMGSGMLIDVLPWMIEEKDNFGSGISHYLEQISQLPLTGDQQLAQLPVDNIRAQQIRDFHTEVVGMLRGSKISIHGSEFRFNSDERIREKMLYMGNRPMADVYGVRVIIDESDRDTAVALLRSQWGNTPDIFPWGLTTVRNMGTDRRAHTFSNDDYQATHVNVIFGGKYIGEVQIVNPQQYKTNLAGEPDFRARERARIESIKNGNKNS